LAMDGLTFRVSVHATAVEAEGTDEEIVRRRDVLVSQNRNEPLEIRHDVLLLPHVLLTSRHSSSAMWSGQLFEQPAIARRVRSFTRSRSVGVVREAVAAARCVRWTTNRYRVSR